MVHAEAPGARPLRLLWGAGAAGPGSSAGSPPDVHHRSAPTPMPERAPVPVVVTIHDCTFFDHPEWHERSKALFFRAPSVAWRRASAARWSA